jgi:hypothetical protein
MRNDESIKDDELTLESIAGSVIPLAQSSPVNLPLVAFYSPQSRSGVRVRGTTNDKVLGQVLTHFLFSTFHAIAMLVFI